MNSTAVLQQQVDCATPVLLQWLFMMIYGYVMRQRECRIILNTFGTAEHSMARCVLASFVDPLDGIPSGVSQWH
ncbi:uncharacterized [Tachysurus ichikawai]